MILFKSLLHNVGVLVVGLLFASLGKGLDAQLGLPGFRSRAATAGAIPLLAVGFALRLWATVHFYQHRLRVVALNPQGQLITSGPYRFSRNPLYLGGNVFIFLGMALGLGSPGAVGLTVLHLPLMDRFIRREERQLEQQFGPAWTRYRERVPRWL